MSDAIVYLVLSPPMASLAIQHNVPTADVTTDDLPKSCRLIPKSATSSFPVTSEFVWSWKKSIKILFYYSNGAKFKALLINWYS